jgi:hypothetical protein
MGTWTVVDHHHEQDPTLAARHAEYWSLLLFNVRCRRRQCRITQSKVLLVLISLLAWTVGIPACHGTISSEGNDVVYRVYPARSSRDAAVMEWGNSAIISAIDAVVAEYGPQTLDAALFEVETAIVVADPVNGIFDDNVTTFSPFKNAAAVHGNMVVVTNTGTAAFRNESALTELDLVRMAMASHAAAICIVNLDEQQPDHVYRLTAGESEREAARLVDIPVISVSFNSAQMLTSATRTNETDPDDTVNHGT